MPGFRNYCNSGERHRGTLAIKTSAYQGVIKVTQRKPLKQSQNGSLPPQFIEIKAVGTFWLCSILLTNRKATGSRKTSLRRYLNWGNFDSCNWSKGKKCACATGKLSEQEDADSPQKSHTRIWLFAKLSSKNQSPIKTIVKQMVRCEIHSEPLQCL